MMENTKNLPGDGLAKMQATASNQLKQDRVQNYQSQGAGAANNAKRMTAPLNKNVNPPVQSHALNQGQTRIPFQPQDAAPVKKVLKQQEQPKQAMAPKVPQPEVKAVAKKPSMHRFQTSDGAIQNVILESSDAKYNLESKLGEGVYGAVYRARDITNDRPVAIKV